MSTTDPRTQLGTHWNQTKSIGTKNGKLESQNGAQPAHTGTSGRGYQNLHRNFWCATGTSYRIRQPTNSRSKIPKSNQTTSKYDETWGIPSQDLHGPIPTRSPQKDPGYMRNQRFPKKGQVFPKNTKSPIQFNS